MSRVTATRVTQTPVETVWQVFTDLAGRHTWLSEVETVEVLTPATEPLRVGTTWRETRVDRLGGKVTEDLVVLAIEPGRCCTLGLAGAAATPRLSYLFTPVAIGANRGGTTIQMIVESDAIAGRRTHRIANRLLAFIVGGFAARTAEGALRDELDCLISACNKRTSASMHTSAA